MKEEDNFSLNRDTASYDKERLIKRARRKYFTNGLISGLIKLDSPLKKSYWNTWHCANVLEVKGDKITTKYCKNRWCMVCNAIRTAQNILSYSEEIKSWGEDAYFVTLTIVNVSDVELRGTIDTMKHNFANSVRVIKTRRNMEFKAIQKLECTINPVVYTFHPHYHCIVKGKAQAELLKSLWLERFPTSEPYLQNIKKADVGTVKELFKYFTKIITNSKSNDSVAPVEYRRKICLEGLDVIFRAIKGKRIIQTYGFKKSEIDEFSSEVINLANQIEHDDYFNWIPELHDWIGQTTGVCLTGYEPSEGFKSLVESINLQNNDTS